MAEIRIDFPKSWHDNFPDIKAYIARNGSKKDEVSGRPMFPSGVANFNDLVIEKTVEAGLNWLAQQERYEFDGHIMGIVEGNQKKITDLKFEPIENELEFTISRGGDTVTEMFLISEYAFSTIKEGIVMCNAFQRRQNQLNPNIEPGPISCSPVEFIETIAREQYIMITRLVRKELIEKGKEEDNKKVVKGSKDEKDKDSKDEVELDES